MQGQGRLREPVEVEWDLDVYLENCMADSVESVLIVHVHVSVICKVSWSKSVVKPWLLALP